MFSRIETAIVKLLQDNLKIPKDNIRAGKLDLKIEKNLPAVTLTVVDFNISEIGIGGSTESRSEGLQDKFSGNGENREFTLTRKPLRPITKVEHPISTEKKEETDYTVDYENGVITFISPPQKGKDNILVKYLPPSETRGLRFDLKYYLETWARDEQQTNVIAVEIIETLLREGSSLARQGIFIRPVRGFNVPPNENVPEGVYGMTLEYSAETELQVEIPVPRIERTLIEVRKA
jgi:hypothetical protein